MGTPLQPVDRDVVRWQKRLLPFMSRFMVVLAIVFFALTAWDAYETRVYVKNESAATIRARIDETLQAQKGGAALDPMMRTLLLLEADALDKRYRQASALLLSRISTRQLAFITGMVLAFIGAVFIIGKLSEAATNVAVGATDWKAGITSSSPGLILAFMGTVLMGIALVVQTPVEVQDRPVYVTTVGIVKNPGGAAAPAALAPDPDPFAGTTPSGEAEKPPKKK